jgi:RNA polymerase sigma factor (sigma-70 family)
MASREHDDQRPLPDNALEVAFSHGDREAFAALLLRHEARLRGAAFRMCAGNKEDAADVYGELSGCLLSGCQTFDPSRDWYRWALQILRNCVNLFYRRARHEAGKTTLNEALHAVDRRERSPEEAAHLAEFKVAFDQCFGALLPEQQELFALHILLGCTFAELATILNLGDAPYEASNRYYEARERLRVCLKSKGFGPLEENE